MTGLKFDPTKPVRTRDGRPARILCADAKGVLPIIALYLDEDEEFDVWTYADGRCNIDFECPLDLVNVPEWHVRWITDLYAESGRIACVPIEFEGEGL